MGQRRSNFLDTAEAAQALRLKKHTMENMRLTGHGPIFHKFGGRVFYHRADLKRWSQACRRRTSSGEKA
jgi:Helix-turn-helix domain